jgi:hypothetical protein
MQMHRNGWEPRHLDRNKTLEKASISLSKIEKLPRWMSRTVAVIILLVISGFFLNGGALLAASFMHVVIGKADMPPSLIYHTTTPAKSTYVLVPRSTLAHSMDQTLIRLHNPADAYIQSDAVDAGVLMQQSLHQALDSIFSDATRTTNEQSPIPAGIPLSQGQ